jgi:hypothetical protein
MTDAFRREAVFFALCTTLTCIAVAPALSQAPTEAQRSAIRSECRSDYEANCASVPPGGAASLQCLQQNMSKLSSSCQSAVRAVETAPAPKAETAPPPADAKPATAAKPATETTAPQSPSKPAGAAAKPSQAQLTAIRSACRSDYQKACSGVPPGGSAALQCLERNKSKVSASCQQAVEAVAGAAGPAAAGAPAAATTATPAAAPATPPTALALRPMRPREEIFVLRSACAGDVRTLCGGVAPGGGRVVQCLATKAAALSAPCKEVLSQFVTR